MLEKLKKLLLATKKDRAHVIYSAPSRAIRVGPESNGVPYMFVWSEVVKYVNNENTVDRISFEFRNMPRCVVRFDHRALPELITALTNLQEEITKNEQQPE